ncbi:MAG TPA: hypothetical protein VI056_05480 [Candidatus Limnocylindria bacterium]
MAIVGSSSTSNLQRTVFWWLVIGTLIVVAVAVYVAMFGKVATAAARDAAATVALATTVAVGIERGIETLWTIVGFFRGAWWPMSIVGTKVDEMVTDLNGVLTPVYAGATDAVQQLAAAGTWTQVQIDAAHDEIAKIDQAIADLRTLAPDDQRVQLIGSATLKGINVLQQKYPQVTASVKVATEAIAGLTNFVGTFKDNPGRRLISLYLGMLIGLVVAGALGIDLFEAVLVGNATLASTAASAAAESQPLRVGVVASGLLLGLGANPTHELIKLLQETKKSRAAHNVSEVQTTSATTTLNGAEQDAVVARGLVTTSPARWKLTRD